MVPGVVLGRGIGTNDEGTGPVGRYVVSRSFGPVVGTAEKESY